MGSRVTEPVLHQGVWWVRHEDGSWSHWDPALQQWIRYQPVNPYYRPRAFDSLRSLGTWTVRALVAELLFSALAVLVHVQQLRSIASRDRLELEDYFNEMAAVQLVNNLGGLISAAAWILLLFWFYRAYRNLEALGTRGRYSPGWAAGAWFVPILNLFRPKQIADDIWRSSDPALDSEPGTAWMQGKVDPLLNWWWAVWILVVVATLIAIPVAVASEIDAGNFESSTSEVSFAPIARIMSIIFIVASGGRILTTALTIPVIARMTRRQEQRATQLGVARTT